MNFEEQERVLRENIRHMIKIVKERRRGLKEEILKEESQLLIKM